MKEQLIISTAASYIRRALKAKFNIEHIKSARPLASDKRRMLYIHVPFCHTFCPYCSFHKFAYEEQLCKQYFKTLRKELQILADEGHKFDTLYVGGGTTLIDEDELALTLEQAKKSFGLKQISAESDPTHLDRLDIFDGLIDRLSCGVQSFDDDILNKTTRIKFGNGEEIAQKLSKAAQQVKALSIDLIFNFPNQSKESLLKDLEIATSLNPAQITTYPLMKSNLTKAKIAAALGQEDKDNEREFYQLICEFFKKANWSLNNAWSFSKQKTSFNDEYCSEFHEYVGAGSGAFSFVNGELLINAFNLDEYANEINQRGCAHTARVKFKPTDEIDYAFLSEYFSTDVDVKSFEKAYGIDLIKHLGWRYKLLDSAKLAIMKNDHLICTDFGRYLALVLMKEFYINMDRVRAYFKDRL